MKQRLMQYFFAQRKGSGEAISLPARLIGLLTVFLLVALVRPGSAS